MTDEQDTYTYRAGDKVALEKLPDKFVVRASPAEAMKPACPTWSRCRPVRRLCARAPTDSSA